MTLKEIFQNNSFRTGGFFELCIQVSKSIDKKYLEEYFRVFWKREDIMGPLNENFETTNQDFEYRKEGVLHISDKQIPFINFNILEENPIETGFNWFDVSFYVTTIEKVFNLTPGNWDEKSICPKILEDYLKNLMKVFYQVHPFELALLDFEISGQYYLQDLAKSDFVNWSNSKVFIGRDKLNRIHENNLKYIEIID